MNALVTGAGGFAGSRLCEHLIRRGMKVTGWVRNEPRETIEGVQYCRVDIRDESACRQAMADAPPQRVFHLGALTSPKACTQNPEAAAATNVQGTVNVFSHMPPGSLGLFASTCHVYGPAGTIPTDEAEPLRPVGVYARTKVDAEDWIRESMLPVVIARAFHHTGETQSTEYALADWCARIREGASSLKVGNLDVWRDYSDVRDVVCGYALLIEEGAHREAYNLCSGESHSMRQFIEWAAGDRVLNIEVEEARVRAADVPDLCGDPARAEGLGWVRKYSIKDTLVAMAGSAAS